MSCAAFATAWTRTSPAAIRCDDLTRPQPVAALRELLDGTP
jgi:hypothetical protein